MGLVGSDSTWLFRTNFNLGYVPTKNNVVLSKNMHRLSSHCVQQVKEKIFTLPNYKSSKPSFCIYNQLWCTATEVQCNPAIKRINGAWNYPFDYEVTRGRIWFTLLRQIVKTGELTGQDLPYVRNLIKIKMLYKPSDLGWYYTEFLIGTKSRIIEILTLTYSWIKRLKAFTK